MILSKSGFFCDFYPRPPGGGRPTVCATFRRGHTFLSTPSGWRATIERGKIRITVLEISIHALRVEGDQSIYGEIQQHFYFYPRPPGGGRQNIFMF